MKSFLIVLLSALFFQSISAQNAISITAEEALEDIEYLVSSFKSVHYNPFSNMTEQEFDQKVESLTKDWKSQEMIPLRNFIKIAMKIGALASGGKSLVEWQNSKIFPELGVYQFIPIKVKRIGGKIVATYSDHEEVAVGTEIKAINGRAMSEIYEDILSYTGGIQVRKDNFAEDFFPVYMFLNYINAPYFVELGNGELAYISEGMSLVDASLMLVEGVPEQAFDFQVLENSIAYLEFNGGVDLDSCKTFLDESFTSIQNQNLTKLIVDIRRNAGGDSRLNELLLSYIATEKYKLDGGRYWKVSEEMKSRMTDSIYVDAFGKGFTKKFIKSRNGSILKDLNKKKVKPRTDELVFTGKSCFLIGPETTFNANSMADAIKTYGLSTLIGLPTGQLTNDFGELIELQLPNSESYFFVTTTFEVGCSGDETEKKVVFPDVTARGNIMIEARKWLNSY